ncbi:MAG: AMP-dependent synthetase/ligase [Candidatus Saccharibacteria bacterium]
MKGAEHNYEAEFEKFLAQEKHLALMVHSRAAKYGDRKIAVRHKPHDQWLAYTWGQFGEMIDATAKGLLALGVKEFDFVGIFSMNSVWWAIEDYASFTIRACSVPIYGTNSAKETQYIIDHAEIAVLFVGSQAQYDKAVTLLGVSPTLKKIIVNDPMVKIQKSDSVMYLDDLMELGRKSGLDQELKERMSRLQSDDLSTLIYTSGTTGTPKGVMLTHKNWFAMLFGTGYHINIIETDVNLAFLPLSHVFERAWSYFILCNNAQVDYCHDTNTQTLLPFLAESRPHYMCSVPRLWEKVHAKLLDQLSEAPPAKQKLFNWALEVGGQYQHAKKDGKPISFGLNMKHKLAEKLVLHKIRDLFGGRNKVYNCGGSAFSGEISEFFFKAGVFLLQGYGMTECFVISVSNPERNKFGTCGPVVPLMNVRISPEGEIQAKGPSMMQGYYKTPELTKEALTEDGWMKTGDQGYIDSEGYIVITDRIKDMFKTSGGKYIAPQQIETLLKEDYYIENAIAVGDGKQYVSALVVPAFEPLEAWAQKNGIKYSSRQELVQHPEVIKFYRDHIDKQTEDLGQVEKVKKFTLMPEEFSQETGELTATQKLKRKIINEKYKDEIAALYAE